MKMYTVCYEHVQRVIITLGFLEATPSAGAPPPGLWAWHADCNANETGESTGAGCNG